MIFNITPLKSCLLSFCLLGVTAPVFFNCYDIGFLNFKWFIWAIMYSFFVLLRYSVPWREAPHSSHWKLCLLLWWCFDLAFFVASKSQCEHFFARSLSLLFVQKSHAKINVPVFYWNNFFSSSIAFCILAILLAGCLTFLPG